MTGAGCSALGRAAVVLAAVALATGCNAGPSTACPAIGWGSRLVVELGDGWPGAGAVRLECPSWCGLAVDPVDDGPDAVTVQLTGSTAYVPFMMAAPEDVIVTVLAADGTVLSTAEVELDWVRVGGSAECGGPTEATVEIPAP